MAKFKQAGISATLLSVLVFLGVLVIIGIIAWMRRTQHSQPTTPASPKVSVVRRVPIPDSQVQLG